MDGSMFQQTTNPQGMGYIGPASSFHGLPLGSTGMDSVDAAQQDAAASSTE